MKEILDLDAAFDVKLFDIVVATALSSKADRKKEAEDILLKFKELPGSWTKIDFILKNSEKQQSKFIALQILEENVKSKWALFSEEMKLCLRQYVFSTVIERAASPPDIILQKANSILIEIAKRDWPEKWSSFIFDLITVSQSTSMGVSSNTLEILRNMNEQVFTAEDDITTSRKRLLRNTLQQEYFSIFRFISVILRYSETQELDDQLLENCLNTFRSFCKSMPPEFVFSTEIVDHILGHLNSPHSTAALCCLSEIVELEKGEFTQTEKQSPMIQYSAGAMPKNAAEQKCECVSTGKIVMIHSELLNFFKMYLRKFEATEKLSDAYKRMSESERNFMKRYAKIFASMYALWINELNEEQVQQGLGYFVEISKIDDPVFFKSIFPTWEKLVYEFYSEYPLRVPTIIPLRRDRFSGVLQAMLPVFVQNMPKPEEVFIVVNDLGEIVKDRQIETAEIEFYKKMKDNLLFLSYCIEEHFRGYFIKNIEKQINVNTKSNDLNVIYRDLNQICWAVGSISGAFDEEVERNFFVSIINTLLTICERRVRREEKAIIASNIMFIIGHYHRFLKYNNEFLFVVIRKLFEFMAETYVGIKEMACDNFYKICEKCPNHLFVKRDVGCYIFEVIIGDLGSITSNLEYYLQRVVLEGLLIVLKNGPKKDVKYVESIYYALTNQSVLNHSYIDGIHTVINDQIQLMMSVHLVESYSLGFKILPSIFHTFAPMESFIYFFSKCSEKDGRNVQILKNSLAGFFEAAVESKYNSPDFLNRLCGCVLVDYKMSYSPSLLSLATAIVNNNTGSPAMVDTSLVQRLQFFISNLIAPSIPFILKADEYPELSVAFLKFLIALLENNFNIFFPLIMESQAYESMMSAIFLSLGSLREISSLGLQTLLLLYRACFENQIFTFLTSFYLTTLENLLGLVFDKDMKNSYDLQVELLFLLISYLNHIPQIKSAGTNTSIVKAFMGDLFSKNFKNLTPNSLNIFIEGVIEIREIGLFREHLDDFNVKIYEYGNDEDIDAELELLKERVAKSN